MKTHNHFSALYLTLLISCVLCSCKVKKNKSHDLLQVRYGHPNERFKRFDTFLKKQSIQKNYRKDYFGIIILGDVGDYRIIDVTYAYAVMMRLGYADSNIFILDADGRESPFYPTRGVSTEKNIKRLFDHLSGRVDTLDQVIVMLLDHGVRVSDTENSQDSLSCMVVPKGLLSEKEMRSYVDQLEAQIIITLAGFCYSGGYTKRLSTGPYVGISSSPLQEPSWGHLTTSFPRHFFGAYDHPGHSDNNRDGIVSIREAFTYACNTHDYVVTNGQLPQIKSELDIDKLTLQITD